MGHASDRASGAHVEARGQLSRSQIFLVTSAAALCHKLSVESSVSAYHFPIEVLGLQMGTTSSGFLHVVWRGTQVVGKVLLSLNHLTILKVFLKILKFFKDLFLFL